jgi:hypothetical protein
MPLFSQSSLRQTLGAKGLGSNFNKALQSSTGAKNSMAAKSQFIKSLANKSGRQRESVYKEFGLGHSDRQQVEKVIDQGKKIYTKDELHKIHKAEEAKKKLNIFLSKRSAEEGGSGYQTGTGSFAGGDVQTRSRVGALDKGLGERGSALGLGQKKVGGFALGSTANAGHGFALGQAQDAKKGFALGGAPAAKKDEDNDKPSSKPFVGGLGAGI